MKRFLVGILFSMFLVSCGGGGTTTLPQTPPKASGSEVIAGTYNGDFQIVDDVDNKFLNGLTTFTVAKDGKVTGTVTTDSSSRPKNEKGTYTGTIIYTSDLDVQFDLVAVFPTAGTYSGKGKGVYATATDTLGGQLTGKNKDDVFVGSFILTAKKE